MKKRRRISHSILVVFSLLTIFLSNSFTVKADSPFDTFSVDGFGRTIYTQPAYEPEGVIARDIYMVDENGEKIYSPLNKPQDLFIDHQDEIYIADTGNNRIVHLDKSGKFVRALTVPESPLKEPSGVFITDNGDIYIADTGNKRVIHLNNEGKMIQEFLRPESKYINKKFVYEPINMIVDRRGFVYVVSRGTFQGIIQFYPDGGFYGFYGTNLSEVSLMDRIRKIFYTKEQLARQVRLLPSPIRNVDIDKNGYIYTVSKDKSEEIKKLNVRGENQWKEFSFSKNVNVSFLREDSTVKKEGQAGVSTDLTDVTVDENGIVTVADKANALVTQFNQNGELLFFWGAPSTSGKAQMGVNQSPVALDTNSENKIFILDDSLNLVQVLEPTQFGKTVQDAYILTQQGKYVESEKYWSEIVRQNALFTPAYTGLARAAFYREDFEASKELYRLAGDDQGYSDSFWQLRLNWFQNNFTYLANAFVVIGLTSIAGVQFRRRSKRKNLSEFSLLKKLVWMKEIKLLEQLKHAFYILRHPLDGFADIRYRNKGGYTSAIVILFLVISMVLVRMYFTSFTFQPVAVGSINIGSILTVSTTVWVSWVICHYLIGSIKQGQARFKDVFVGSAYALFPVFLLGVPLAILSNMMSLNESSIYGFFNMLMIIWSAALFFWLIQALQNYSVGETIINSLLSLFSMIMLWVLVFIVIGLSSETIDFFLTLYREVTM
ncbi:YIP1 family protein [Neobacillus vireti]|uniref:YIP1 family protein n=1 Tax=Neobacillus vireti TaxID=220686 RepID=UPI002FFEB0AF